MTVINMYKKITLCLLIVLVIVRSEEVSTTKNAEIADFSNLRLSTVLPYPSYNDENVKKDNSKRSLLLLMPLSQTRNEHEKLKETVQKTKRCGTQRRKNRFLLLSTKEDSNKERTIDKIINVGISKQNLDDHTIKNAKYSGKSVASKRMIAEEHKDEMLLQALKENLNAEDVIININSQEKSKKCNTEKYICHCKEENCISSSSKKSSSGMLGSKIDKPERTNRRLTNHENTKPYILQQKLPILYENPHELSLPNLIDHFSIQPYQEKINIPPVPVLYGIVSDISPHIVENERKYVGIPFTSFEKSNYLVGNNQYQSIHQKPCVCAPITEGHQVKSSMSATSPSINYVDATTIRETTNNLESNNLIGQTEEDQEHFPELTTKNPNVDLSAHSERETNLPLNYLTEESNTVSSSNLNEVTPKSEDFSEQTERNPNNNLSKLTTFSTDYAGTSNAPSFIYDGTNDGKFINMEECIQLFGRDICVLSATSPKMLGKQVQENNLNKYSTIRIPEYVTQMSARKETMLNNINYLDKFKITSPYFASESSTNGINKPNINLNKYLESTSVKSNVDVDKAFPHEFHRYPESIGQISEPVDKNKSFSTAKSTHTPMKKLIDPTNDETAKAEKNKLLGKSKSHTTKLLLNSNNKEITNSTSGEKFLYSTPSYKSSSDEEMNNLKINQQNQVTNTNSNSSTSPKNETIVTSYDSKTRYDSKEQNRNDFKKSNINVYSEKKIPQEHFKEDTTITSSNSKTGYNFEEVTKKEIIGIEPSVHPEEIFQERFTTMQYIDDKKSSNLNHKEDVTNNVEELIDSSTSKLPFCDNTLLLNSIRKVINDFALDSRLTKTKDLNENILQTQGKNLLPKILQVPNLKNILSMPQIENTIVEKVKDVLSYVTAIPRRDFTNDWSHDVIKNTLRSILDALSGFHHKLPPMTLEEHQFKDGQWRTNLVTLAPILDQKLSKGIQENLRESITDLLSSPAIASQIDQHIVRNMIVQSVKNSLTNEENDKMDDSIIHILNDILQTLKNSKVINTLGSNEVISDEEDMDINFSQEIPTNNYKIGINIDNSTLNNKQNLDTKEDKMDNKKITDYQKAKTLENNANILTTSELPHLLQLAKIKENIRDFEQIKKLDMQDNTEKKLVEPKITYHKAILQNNPNVLAILEPDSAETEQNIKNHRIDEESIKDTTTITNFIQETSPNYAQVSDSKMLENTARSKDVGVKHTLNEKTLTTSTEIDPLIILERIKFNLPPTKYYSPEILKYATSHTDDKNVEITTASTNFIQETSSNTQMSDNVILQNTTEINQEDEMAYLLTTTSDNLISSTNVEYKDYKPKTIALTDKNILESQQNSQQNFTEGNIIKIHEVTTEIQRTYAKTTYFKTGPFSNSNPRISSSSLTCETTNICVNNNNKENNNGNMGDDNNNLNGDKINTDNAIKAKEVISTSKLSTNNTDPSQLFPSSIAPDISELQKSQLYYTSDGMKLPLEIKRLEDGSYALSISKNICEQILMRKCPCCVPLQGYVVQSLKNHQQEDMHAMTSTTTEKKDKENMYVNNIKKDYQSVQPFNTMVTSMITRRNALRTQMSKEEEEEKKINAAHLWKQNDNLTIIMPVVDFAKKYNLSLDYNEEKIPFNEVRLQNKMQNYDKLLMKSEKISEYDQSEEKNLNNYLDIKKNRFLGDSNIVEVRKANAEMNQSEIGQESKLREARTANDIQNINIKQKVNSENRERTNTVFKGINISERSKINKGEIKWDKLSDIIEGNTKVFRKEEATELIDNESNVPEIKNFKENIEKPCRYQRNTNDVTTTTKRTELVKSMLYWLKGLFVSK